MPGFQSPVLETFTVGADVNPLSTDAKWAQFRTSGGSVLRVEADVDAIVNNSAANDGFYYYTPIDSAQTDYEVRFKVQVRASTNGDRLGCFVRGQIPGGANFNCYWLRLETASGTDLVVLGKVVSGATSTLVSVNHEIVNGEEYCLRAVGSALEVWLRDGSGDTQLISTTDSTYASGVGGVHVRGNAAQLDDFGWVILRKSLLYADRRARNVLLRR